MRKAWKELDLAGGGLQSANLRLAALLRKRRTAYALLLLFPLGLHRDYLRDRRGAWLYRAAAMLSAAAWLAGYPGIGLAMIGMLAAGAVYEAFRIDDAVAGINKQLRMQVYLSQTSGTPRGFKGHYTDDNMEDDLETREQQDAAHSPQSAQNHRRGSRTPSFAEQEKMLREMAEIHRKNRK